MSDQSDYESGPVGDTFHHHYQTAQDVAQEIVEAGDATPEEASVIAVVVTEELTGGYYE